jgi:hypothetical protein
MTDFEKQAHMAQSQLMQRASILMLMGYKGMVETYTYPSIGCLKFNFGNLVEMKFDNEAHPFSQDEVDMAICTLDAAIEERFKEAQHAIEVVKAWRGE